MTPNTRIPSQFTDDPQRGPRGLRWGFALALPTWAFLVAVGVLLW